MRGSTVSKGLDDTCLNPQMYDVLLSPYSFLNFNVVLDSASDCIKEMYLNQILVMQLN
jgi:hypothetical protein